MIFSRYREHGVHCGGRFGEWLYINSDDAVLRGKQAVEAINAKE